MAHTTPSTACRPRMSIADAAAYLNCGERTIRRYIAEGRLRAYRLAGQKIIRLDPAEVEALLEPVGGAA